MEPQDRRRDYVWIFEEVPREIKLIILSWLDLGTINDCSLVSKEFYEFTRDNQIWFQLCERVWGVSSRLPSHSETQRMNISWRQYFVEKHLLSSARNPQVIFSSSVFPSCISARYRHSCVTLPANSENLSQFLIFGGTGPSSDITFGDSFLVNVEQQPNNSRFVKGILGLMQKLSASPGDRESKPLWSAPLSLTDSELNIKVFPLSQWEGKPDSYKSTRNFSCCVGNKVWIWGGSHSFPPVKTDELFVLDVESQKWTKVNAKGEPPSARSDHCGAVVGNSFYIFGGSDVHVKPLADVHMFNTETKEWSAISPKGYGPSPRSGHTCAALGTKIYVYGGATWDPKVKTWKDKSNEIFIFDTITHTWTKPVVTGDIPAVSTFVASFIIGNHFWLIGGGSKQSDFVSNSVYVCDTITMHWKKFVAKGLENFQAKDCISATVAGEKVFLFGGFRGEPVNDLQCIDMRWASKLKSSLGRL